MNTTRRTGIFAAFIGVIGFAGCSAPVDDGDQSTSFLSSETILEAKLYDVAHPMPPSPDCDVYTAATVRSDAEGTLTLHLQTRRDGTCAVDLPNDERTYTVKKSLGPCNIYEARLDGVYSVRLRDGRVRSCGSWPSRNVELQEARDGALRIRYSDPTLDVDPDAATYQLATPIDTPIAHVYEGNADGVSFRAELRLPAAARASQLVTSYEAVVSALPVLVTLKVTSPTGSTEIDASFRRDLVLREYITRATEPVESVRHAEWRFRRGDHSRTGTLRNVEVILPSLKGTYATANALLPVSGSQDLAVKDGVLTLGPVPDTLDVLAILDPHLTGENRPRTTITLTKSSP